MVARMMSRAAFDNRGQTYNVSAILTPEGTLDIEKYKQYSPLFISYVRVPFMQLGVANSDLQHGLCDVIRDEFC